MFLTKEKELGGRINNEQCLNLPSNFNRHFPCALQRNIILTLLYRGEEAWISKMIQSEPTGAVTSQDTFFKTSLYMIGLFLEFLTFSFQRTCLRTKSKMQDSIKPALETEQHQREHFIFICRSHHFFKGEEKNPNKILSYF